jgi:hypothetical protein
LRPAREAAQAGRARVKRELLAETNGPYITSELFFLTSGGGANWRAGFQFQWSQSADATYRIADELSH